MIHDPGRTIGNLLGVLALGSLAACGAASVPGQPSPATAAASSAAPVTSKASAGSRSAAQIEPCKDLSVEDVTRLGLGLDPASKITTNVAGQVVAERGCGWTGTDTLVDVHASNGTVALYKTKTNVEDVRFPIVAGMTSITFHVPGDPGGCSLLSDIAGGALVVQFRVKGEHEAAFGTDACTGAIRVMEQVAPILLKPR